MNMYCAVDGCENDAAAVIPDTQTLICEECLGIYEDGMENREAVLVEGDGDCSICGGEATKALEDFEKSGICYCHTHDTAFEWGQACIIPPERVYRVVSSSLRYSPDGVRVGITVLEGDASVGLQFRKPYTLWSVAKGFAVMTKDNELVLFAGGQRIVLADLN